MYTWERRQCSFSSEVRNTFYRELCSLVCIYAYETRFVCIPGSRGSVLLAVKCGTHFIENCVLLYAYTLMKQDWFVYLGAEAVLGFRFRV